MDKEIVRAPWNNSDVFEEQKDWDRPKVLDLSGAERACPRCHLDPCWCE